MQPDVHFGLGYLLWTEGKWAEAAKEFQAEIQSNPEHLSAREYLADSLVQQNEFAEALPELEKLAAVNVSEPIVHLDLGMIYAHNGRNEEAIRELRIVEESDPEDMEAHIKIARIYQSVGKREEASTELERARTLQQQSHASLEETIDAIESPTP